MTEAVKDVSDMFALLGEQDAKVRIEEAMSVGRDMLALLLDEAPASKLERFRYAKSVIFPLLLTGIEDDDERRAALADVTAELDLDAATLISALTEAESDVTEEDEDGNDGSPLKLLLDFTQTLDAFHTPDERTFATIRIGDHQETWPVRSKRMSGIMRSFFYRERRTAPRPQVLEDAISTLEARALEEGETIDVHRRMAFYENKLYVDLCNDEWEVVEVTRSGWKVTKDCPVKFERDRISAALPNPVTGGSVERLKDFLNTDEESFKLMVGWLLGAFSPEGPYPLLQILGWQGTAKSTATRIMMMCVDPKDKLLRALPTSEHDLAIAASNSYAIGFDNVSGIRGDISDTLCRISTGGGLSKRKLYSDDEEIVFDVRRPVVLNGINNVIGRADLQERAITVALLPIRADERRSEREFKAAFEKAHPLIFGAILDILSGVLDRYDSVELDSTPRMADFTIWVTAAERALGWEDGEFMRIYTESLEDASIDAMDTDPVVGVLRKVLEDATGSSWSGTSTALLEELSWKVDETTERSGFWPKSASSLSRYLRRIAPQLETIGIEFAEGESGHEKTKIKTLKLTEEYTRLS